MKVFIKHNSALPRIIRENVPEPEGAVYDQSQPAEMTVTGLFPVEREISIAANP